MKKLFLLLFVLGCLQAMAQDTTYFDYKWQPCSGRVAYYYRLSNKNGDVYEVNDYFKKSGKLQMNGFYKDLSAEVRHGKFTWYYESGQVEQSTDYHNGKRISDTVIIYNDTTYLSIKEKRIYQSDTLRELHYYYPSGACNYQSTYENEHIKLGITYYETGEVKRKDYYNKRGEWRNGQCFKKNGEDTAYYPSIVYPIIDGLTSFYQPEFISKYIVYPEHARMRGIQGKAIISYTVESDGTLSNIKLLYATHDFFGESALEAMRMITNKWIPAKKEGQISKITITQPVKFTLN